MLSPRRYQLLLFLLFSLWLGEAGAQRTYRDHSVLATGSWYQVAVERPGVYRLDMAFLNRLGITGASLPSASIRVFGGTGNMLPEANSDIPPDDLTEIAVWVEDGGDGNFSGPDYLLFYAQGPDTWQKDSVRKTFRHQRNLYSRYTYYYISIQGQGARITPAPQPGNAISTVNQYDARYFYELDSINLLASGREWYGEEFAEAPGKTTSRSFQIPMNNAVGGTAALRVSAIARSVGSGSRFDLRINNNPIGSLDVLPTGAGQYDPIAREATDAFNFLYQPGDLQIQFVPGSFNAQGWLNWFEFFYRGVLRYQPGSQLDFRDWSGIGPGNARFELQDLPANGRVWDITDPQNPVQMSLTTTGTITSFINDASRLREYIAFDPSSLPPPVAVGRVANQDLHATSPVDYIIVTHSSLINAANRLADLHRQRQSLRVKVVTTQEIFHEFAAGKTDPVAIRDFVKMYFDKYGQSADDRPKYLLLFGDASYDNLNRIPDNTNLVPTWQNGFSLDVLASYASDDFFGFLEDDEDINSGAVINDLDIGIGRIPARNEMEAMNYVNKVEAYMGNASLGPWRTQLGLVADDKDQNAHLQDAEQAAATIENASALFDIQKIYLDAFPQQADASGGKYPLANQAIENQLFNGNLIWNFTGHGGPRRLAEETLLDQQTVDALQNENRLPLFLTATCDFAPFDNPSVASLGENLLLRPRTGAIALMTTTRIVFSSSNRVMNNNYLRFALEPDANGEYRTLGEAVRAAKNFTYQTSTDHGNNRKFTLLGDPAVRLSFPQHKVHLTRINGQPLSSADTLRASEKVVLEGEVRDRNGNLLPDFNGTVYATVFDKIATVNTLGNDPASPVTSFQSWNHVLFKGKATAGGGRFAIQFKVPRDIRYDPGAGRISLYAENGSTDAMGVESSLMVGGSGVDADNDKEGPDIRIYLNDTRFVPGGTSNEKPLLLLELADSSGINTLGTGIGHDLTVMIDNDPDKLFVLNKYYEANQDSYRQGKVRFQLPELEPGNHTLKVKAWDVVNNSSEGVLDFVVASDQELVLKHVLNYPNPFTTRTQFCFEHNQPAQDLEVSLQVFTLSGRIIKVFQRTINTTGNRSCELEWDGRDEYGAKIGRGVYLYRLSVKAPGKKRKEKIEKLVIF